MNTVIGPYDAEIDGRSTALAGCDQSMCDKRSYCLRADAQLKSRATWKLPKDSCSAFIPVETFK